MQYITSKKMKGIKKDWLNISFPGNNNFISDSTFYMPITLNDLLHLVYIKFLHLKFHIIPYGAVMTSKLLSYLILS